MRIIKEPERLLLVCGCKALVEVALQSMSDVERLVHALDAQGWVLSVAAAPGKNERVLMPMCAACSKELYGKLLPKARKLIAAGRS